MIKATAVHPSPKPNLHIQTLDKHLHAQVSAVCRSLAIDTKITNARLQLHQLGEDAGASVLCASVKPVRNDAAIDALIVVRTKQAANNVRQEALAT